MSLCSKCDIIDTVLLSISKLGQRVFTQLGEREAQHYCSIFILTELRSYCLDISNYDLDLDVVFLDLVNQQSMVPKKFVPSYLKIPMCSESSHHLSSSLKKISHLYTYCPIK